MNHFLSGLLLAGALCICIPVSGRAASESAGRPKPAATGGATALDSRLETASSGCLADTTQADFQAGVASNVDLTTSPGDAILLAPSTLDQQNTTVGVVGFGFSSTVWYAQTFTPAVTGSLAEVDLEMFCAGCTGTTPDVTVSIRNVIGGNPNGNDLATATIPGFSSATPAFMSAAIVPPPHLTAGTTYAVVVRSIDTPSAGNYSYSVSVNNPYAGGHSARSTNSGVSWAAQTTDVGFKTFMRTLYMTSGNLTSSTKDSNPGIGDTPNWTSLSWHGSTPANTSLKFQIAGSNSAAGPFSFVGPDGTAATYFTTSNASLLQFGGERYVQYRAYLATTDDTVTPVLSSATVCFVQGPPSDVSISNDDGVASATPGTTVPYTITASNTGPGNASGVAVADSFPPSLTCMWTCTGTGGGMCTTSGSGSINDSVDLPDDSSVTYTASCLIDASATGSLSNTATATYAGDANLTNNSATDVDTLTPKADLSIGNDDNVSIAVPGTTVNYVIAVSNAGPSSAPGSTVTDTFPAALTCSWTCGGTGGGTCTASGSGPINDSAGLPATASVTYNASCLISASATGSVINSASVAVPAGVADPVSGNNSADDINMLAPQADVAVTISDSRDYVRIGDVLDYKIEVSNPVGPSIAIATVTDVLPSQLANGVWTCMPSTGVTCGSGSGNTLGDTATLPVGGKASYLYSASVESLGIDGEIVNMASAELTSGTDPTPANDSATDTDAIVIFEDGFEGAQTATANINAAEADP